MDNEVAEARARLAQRFGKVQLGGKGTPLFSDWRWKRPHRLRPLSIYAHNLLLLFVSGTQRRPQKKTPAHAQATVAEDKKVKAAIKKFGK